MRKKLWVLILALILAVAVPLAVAQIAQQTQSIHVSGNASYPQNAPNSTPSPAATQAASSAPAIKFSLWFPNGTSCPASLSNLPCNIYGPLSSINPLPAKTELVVRNDGNVPINVTASASNVNVPGNIQFNMAGDVEANPIAPGQTANLYIAITMATTNTNFVSGSLFSYSFDVTITTTQA